MNVVAHARPGFTLTPDELQQLTGRKRCDAQRAALDRMQLRYGVRPDGSLAVLRAHVEQQLGGTATPGGTMAPREPQLRP